MTERRHWKEIDILYAAGIILVVIGHSHSSNWNLFADTVLEWLIQFIYSFHMSLFFFIAGFLFINSSSFERDGFWKWFKNRAVRLLTPYLFWSMLALVPKHWFEHNGFRDFSLQSILLTLATPRAGVWGHFWFLPVLCMVYLLFGLWRLLVTPQNKRLMILMAMSASLILFFAPVQTGFLGLSDVKSVLIYFAFGMLVNTFWRIKPCKKWKTIGMIVGGAAFFCTVLLNLLPYQTAGIKFIIPFLMITACWFFAFVLPENKLTIWLSGNNFSIYIFSWFFQAAAMYVCDRLHSHWLITFFSMLFSGFVGSALIVFASKKAKILHHKFFKLIIGMR